MTVEERIGATDRRKMDGNNLFKEEKLEEAMQQYEMVMDLFSFFLTITERFLTKLLPLLSDFDHGFCCLRPLHTWGMILCFSCMGSTRIWLWQLRTHATLTWQLA